MAQPMALRKFKWSLKFGLAKLLVGSKATAPHFAFVGTDASRLLCRRIIESGHRKVLVVTDEPLRELGLVDRALEALAEAEVELHWYDGVQPDPTFEQVIEGARVLQVTHCTAVVAVGGGSSIDAAKMIAASLDPSANPRDWVGFNKAPETAAPIYIIPTTAGTGSEATMGAVITDERDQTKNVIGGAALLARAVALDAGLMTGLPPHITAATGLDALTHGIEAWLSLWDRGTRAETALMAIKGVFRWLPVVMAQPDNLEARQGMALAAYYGGVAINQVNVGAVHAIAHQLGARYHIPHGVANAMVLPHVLRIYGGDISARLAELAPAVGLAVQGGMDGGVEKTANAVIEAIETLRHAVGLPANSDAINVLDFGQLIEAAIEESDGYFSPRLLTEAEVETVLRSITAQGSAAA